MTVPEAMKGIESPRFSALTNLASDFETFLTILVEQPEVQALATAMTLEGVREEVFHRLMELADAPVEDGYEHPADTAMAAYLWLLSQGNGHFSETAVDTIAKCKQCWWSRKMAEHVRNASPFRSGGEPVGASSRLAHPTGQK